MNKRREESSWNKLLCSVWLYNQYNLISAGVFLVWIFGKEKQILFP